MHYRCLWPLFSKNLKVIAAGGIPKSLQVADKPIPLKGPTCRGARKAPSWVHVRCPELFGQNWANCIAGFGKKNIWNWWGIPVEMHLNFEPWDRTVFSAMNRRETAYKLKGHSKILQSWTTDQIHGNIAMCMYIYIYIIYHIYTYIEYIRVCFIFTGMATSRTSCTVHSLLFWYQSLLEGKGWFRGPRRVLHFQLFESGCKASRVILQTFKCFLVVSLPSIQMCCIHS